MSPRTLIAALFASAGVAAACVEVADTPTTVVVRNADPDGACDASGKLSGFSAELDFAATQGRISADWRRVLATAAEAARDHLERDPPKAAAAGRELRHLMGLVASETGTGKHQVDAAVATSVIHVLSEVNECLGVSTRPRPPDPVDPVPARRVTAGANHGCAINRVGDLYCWGTTPEIVDPGIRYASVDGGSGYTCGVREGGELVCWGNNKQGQLGDGTTTNRPAPGPVAGGLSVKSVSAGFRHTCAIALDDRVHCWGANRFGQLGDGTTIDRPSPAPVAGDHAFSSVDAGWNHTCGITEDHAVLCWGDDGTASSPTRWSPGQIDHGIGFLTVSLGRFDACGVAVDGTAYCWPTADTWSSSAPVPVTKPLSFTNLSAGRQHQCATATNGKTYCWGLGKHFRLGNGFENDHDQPRRVAGSHVFVGVSAGAEHTCAIDAHGDVYCWGRGKWGGLGTGNTVNGRTPVKALLPHETRGSISLMLPTDPSAEVDAYRIHLVGGPAVVPTVAAPPGTTEIIDGLLPGTYAVGVEGLEDGRVATLGVDDHVVLAPLGSVDVDVSFDPFTVELDPVPPVVRVGADLTVTFTSVAGAPEYVVELSDDAAFGTVISATRTTSTTADVPIPFAGRLFLRAFAVTPFGSEGVPSSVRSVTASSSSTGIWSGIAAGGRATCGVVDDTTLCWGLNDFGQLGNGTTAPTLLPAPVSTSLEFTRVKVGWRHTCALATDGSAHCWGRNDSTFPAHAETSPRAIHGGLEFRSLAAGFSHTCAIAEDAAAHCWTRDLDEDPVPVAGGVPFSSVTAGLHFDCGLSTGGVAHCWGENPEGQLGDGSTEDRDAPAPVTTSVRFKDIGAGWDHVCALALDGTPYCWGQGTLVPTPLGTPLRFTSLDAGRSFTCAVATDDAAYCWGKNLRGQLGDGTTDDSATPVRVVSSPGFASVSAGQDHACALALDGAAYCWGANFRGALGDGSTAHSPVPVPVRHP